MSSPLNFQFLHYGLLHAPEKMEPAVVLQINLREFTRLLLNECGFKGPGIPRGFIARDRSGDAVYLLIREEVELAFVEFHEEPREIHVCASDEDVRRWPGRDFITLLQDLPLKRVRGHWWERYDQEWWPGNGSEPFYVNGGRDREHRR